MRKINFGAGPNWFKEGWEVLDNGTANYDPEWKHRGKCWDSNLDSNSYDILYTHHMLEHVPHFRMEKVIAEFNRVTKMGGTLRVVVPNLKTAVMAYVNNDESLFSHSRHYSDHMGLGAMFVRTLISPGKETIAMSREMDEVLGSYAHLYSYDFDMLRTLLEKWGFSEVVESEPGGSSTAELQEMQHFVFNGEKYDLDDPFVREKKYQKEKGDWYFSGFDKKTRKSLCVECVKVREEPYAFEKEYEFNKGGRYITRLDKVKLSIFRVIVKTIDFIYLLLEKSGIINILKRFK